MPPAPAPVPAGPADPNALGVAAGRPGGSSRQPTRLAPAGAGAGLRGAGGGGAGGARPGRLGGSSRKHARIALAVAGAVLEADEVVEAVVAGRLDGNVAVVVLTDRALVLADERQWRPVVERFALDAGLQVQGWQDDRTASLTLLHGGRQLVVDRIADRPLAVEMAQRIRARTGA